MLHQEPRQCHCAFSTDSFCWIPFTIGRLKLSSGKLCYKYSSFTIHLIVILSMSVDIRARVDHKTITIHIFLREPSLEQQSYSSSFQTQRHHWQGHWLIYNGFHISDGSWSTKEYDKLSSWLISHSDHDSIKNIKEIPPYVYTDDTYQFCNIDINIIRSHFNTLKCNKVISYDILPFGLLKIDCDILCQSICYLVNTSFRTCSFPNSTKHTEICSIYKKVVI